ncbi:hypothetical protein SAMN05216389_10383 [Oceanobacillus limi]|uniref:Polysaccharide deacetylase n=1 Tax=Oceanobacillus limi TaxID=930131 RepID=A0A1I0A5N6_9BACI|nr:hypothetical protein [Oceanobacillus limi]SES89285.1 hypothetical protein SAMN05216389_10383 [Oceanobacillus limi]
MNTGKFVISLDLELNWGVFDVFPLNRYRANLLGAREVVPLLLNKFQQHGIHATWAVVGFLFFSNKKELVEMIPKVQPQYTNSALSSYHHLQHIGENEEVDPFHYGSLLIDQIREFPNQEVATHTFSHYYCLADGQDQDAFRADLTHAITIAKQQNLSTTSIVFPRNQVEPSYLSVCENKDLTAYRGCENNWLYHVNPNGDGKLKRAMRLLDSYINITGHHVYCLEDLQEHRKLVNVPSSRFLRPYSRRLRLFESLRLKRIKSSMTKAAKEGKVYHLWWHPHNFGVHMEENSQMLDLILDHFHQLRSQYGMESLSMRDMSEKVLDK